MTISLNLFGSFEVMVGGETLEVFPVRKVQALLIYLAVECKQPHRREELFTLLWPGMPEKSARNNLRQALYSLGQNIPDLADKGSSERIPFLVADRQTIRLNPDVNIEVDIHQFETHHNQVQFHDHLDVETCSTCQEALEAAIALYQGDFLAHFYLDDSNVFEEWARGYREKSRRETLEALDTLTNIYMRERDYERARELCERQLELDPLRESAHQQMMAVLTLSDQRPKALAQYETLQQLLQDELGVVPSEKTRLLYEQLLKGQMPLENINFDDLHHREALTVGACPYRGLAAFREADAPFFFGRESFTEQLYAAVISQPLVAVIVGPSGAGKSSILHAGLLPKLREVEDDQWLIAEFRPGSQPFQSLAAAVVPLLEPNLSETERLIEARNLSAALQEGKIPLDDVVRRVLALDEGVERLLLLVDQFEELYTLCADSTIQQAFLDSLLGAVEDSETDCDSCLVLLNTLRADFMGQALGYRPFADALQNASLLLGPMTRDELRSAIEKPAELQGAAFETGLVERLLDDVGQAPGALPLLEFALTLLWDNMDQGWLTHEAYEQIGRVDGALATYADQVYADLKPEEQEQTRKAFMQLVQPGQGTEDTRRIAVRTDLVGVDWSLIQFLADKRLVVTGLDDAGSETVEVVHEALISNWGQLQVWMIEDRAFRIWQEGLRAALRSWETSDRDEGALLRGVTMGQAEEWLEARGAEIGDSEQNFIQTSVDFQEQREAERNRRRRMIVGSLAIGLVVALVLSTVAFLQWRAAKRQADIALSRELAAASLNSLEIDPELSVLLALQGLSRAETLEAESALHKTLPALKLPYTMNNAHNGQVSDLVMNEDGTKFTTVGQDGILKEWELDLGTNDLAPSIHLSKTFDYGGLLQDIAFSPDSDLWAIVADDDNFEAPKLINAATGEVVHILERHQGGVWGVDFHPDGSLVATGGDDGTVRIWEVATGQERFTLTVQEENIKGAIPGATGVTKVKFSPNGSFLASVGTDGTLHIWDPIMGQEKSMITAHESPIYAMDISPVGELIATTSQDSITRIWHFQPETHALEITLELEHDDWVFAIAFSPDGKQIATGSVSGAIKVWDAATGRELMTLYGHVGAIHALVFTADLKHLISAAEDSSVKVWDLSPDREILTLGGKGGASSAYSPNGEWLATGDHLGTITVWDSTTGEEVMTLSGHDGRVVGLEFSPDGTLLASGSWDGTAKLWDLTTGNEIRTMDGHNDEVWEVAFSSDGKLLATASWDQTARIWEVGTGKELLVIPAHDAYVVGVDFNPDGSRLITGGWDSRARIWDTQTGALVGTLQPEADAFAVVFDRSGNRVVIGGRDGSVSVWEIATQQPKKLWDVSGHTGIITRLAINSAETLLASASFDGAAKVWDLSTGEELLTLSVPKGIIFDVDFNPADTHLAMAVDSGNTRIVTLKLEELIALARSRVTRSLTDQECQTYLHLEECPTGE